MKLAISIENQFLFEYPSFKSAQDVFTAGVNDWLPATTMDLSTEKYNQQFTPTGYGIYTRGSIFYDLFLCNKALMFVSQSFCEDNGTHSTICLSQKSCGAVYDENINPIRCDTHVYYFIVQEMLKLFNHSRGTAGKLGNDQKTMK
jgi:hypothetical protein